MRTGRGEGTAAGSNKGTDRKQPSCQGEGDPHVPCSTISARPINWHAQGLLFRWVDPGGSGENRRLRDDALKADGMGGERSIERDSALLGPCRSGAIVDCGRSHEADSAVTVFVVVPVEELLAVSASVLNRAETIGEVGSVLQGFELRLGVRIVIRDMRAAVGLTQYKLSALAPLTWDYLRLMSTPNHRRHFGGVRRTGRLIVMRFGLWLDFRGTRPVFHRRVGRTFCEAHCTSVSTARNWKRDIAVT